jgi:hypothetical protein
MKDIHGERSAPGRIPLISPLLHCVAMPALVYLRSSFGYTLFRPRTIFFSLSVAVSVLDYIAWHEPELWREYRAVCVFGAGAVALYWLHFGVTFIREIYRKSEQDDYSGTPHALRVLKRFGFSGPAVEMNVHLWLEPAAVLLVAAILRFIFTEPHLSAWLVVVAGCMFAKEALNYWTEIRREKIARDITNEAEERGEALGGSQAKPETPQAARVASQTMKRNAALSEEEARARRFAQVLGIAEPYDLEEAEANYRDRLRLIHPDTHENSPENNARTAELNEAIEFFREKLGG